MFFSREKPKRQSALQPEVAKRFSVCVDTEKRKIYN